MMKNIINDDNEIINENENNESNNKWKCNDVIIMMIY